MVAMTTVKVSHKAMIQSYYNQHVIHNISNLSNLNKSHLFHINVWLSKKVLIRWFLFTFYTPLSFCIFSKEQQRMETIVHSTTKS